MSEHPLHLDASELQKHTRRLRVLAKALVADEHTADDLVQDAWVTALERPPKTGWTLATWLRGITRNHARQQAREQSRRTRREHIAATPEKLPSEDHLERVDLLRHLLEQVRHLDEPYRSTLLLRYFDGLSPRKIAQKQGVPHATVRTRLHRGIDQLRTRMDRATGGDRRAWIVPLVPFAAVPDGGMLAGLGNGAARIGELGNHTLLIMSAKKPALAAVGILLIGATATITVLWTPRSATPNDRGQFGASSTKAERDSGPPAELTAKNAAEKREVLDGTDASGLRVPIANQHRGITVRGVVRSAKGEPLAGAKVSDGRLSTQADAEGRYALVVGASATKLPSASKEDESGTAALAKQFRSTTDARLKLVASRPGYVMVWQSALIAPEATELELDFNLFRGFVITGRVTDPEGRPIAGARVWTFRENEPATQTDPQGRYRLDEIDPRRPQQWVHASAEGFIANGRAVPTSGDGATRDLVLHRGAIVRGVIQGDHGAPVADANIEIDAGKSAKRTKSDRRGGFTFTGTTPGERRLVVRHADYAVEVRRIAVPEPGQEVFVHVDLRRGATIAGVVLDDRGKPVFGAFVEARDEKTEVGAVKTDESGAFEIRGLPQGEMWVHCRASGFLDLKGTRTVAGTRDLELRLQRAASIAGRVVAAADGEPVTQFTLRFIPPGSNREGREGQGGKEQGSKGMKQGAEQAFVSATGEFQFEGLPAGFVTGLEIRADGYAPAFVNRATARIDARPDDLRIALDAGARLSGEVREAANGTPVAGASIKIIRAHNPIEPDSFFGSGRRMTPSDAAGRFEFTHVAAGEIHLAVEHPKWGLVIHPVLIPEGSAPVHTLVHVDRQATLAGSVKNKDGGPDAGAAIALTAVEVPGLRSKTWRTHADETGKFTIEQLPRGVYRLARTQPIEGGGGKGNGKNLESLTRFVAITANKRHEVVLSTQGLATLRGTITSPGEVPVSVYVRLQPQPAENTEWEQRAAPQATMATNGSFEFAGLRPGRFRAECWFHDATLGRWMHGTKAIEIALTGVEHCEIAVAPVEGK